MNPDMHHFNVRSLTTATSAFENTETHLIDWPPATFGEVPQLRNTIERLERSEILHPIENGMLCPSSESEKVVRMKEKCPLLLCWAAQYIKEDGSEYLVLPPTVAKDGTNVPTHWIDDGGLKYPSEAIYVRQAYKDLANLILDEASKHDIDQEVRMILSGTSGIGKSFFIRLLIWKLLHPPRGVDVPDTIIWKNKQAGMKGCLYHLGHFYMIDDITKFIASNACGELVDKRNAWIIYDGDAPQDSNFCRTLVVSSPGNLFKDAPHVKQFRKSAFFRVYSPIWSLDELLKVATCIHGRTGEDRNDIIERYKRFGGIARYVLQDGFTFDDPQKTDPIKEALNPVSVVQAIGEFQSGQVDNTKSSGVLVHLIPDENYRQFRYEWGSTYIMEKSFEQLFRISKKSVETMLVSAEGLHTGTFYGILFEPWFHARIKDYGYIGRFRKLTTGWALNTATKKRSLFGKSKEDIDPLNIQEHTIPRSPANKFYYKTEIDPNGYNVPCDPTFASLDSFYPSRGEIYQVTSAERHPIKTENLSFVRPYFADYLSRNNKVKFIFVVPPKHFETFTIQPFHDPAQKKQEKENDLKAAKKESRKGKEVERSETSPKIKVRTSKLEKEEVAQDRSTLFDSTWIEQWVLEMDVNPLTDALRLKIQEEAKKQKKDKISSYFFKKKAN